MGIEELKKKSIVDVAADLGVPLKKISSAIYEHEEHDSFKVFTDTNTFKWFSRDIQGDVINFVQLMKDVSLKEALFYLQNGAFKPVEAREIKQKPFRYFLEDYEQADFKEARKYLLEERSLSDSTIKFFREKGVLAETIKKTNAYYEPVIVFKYLDKQKNIKGASLQGIRENNSLYERGRLKQILKNSDGQMGFSVDIGQPKRLVFAEAPIDLMSYYELNKDRLSNVRLVAMEGLKEATIARYSLELIGTLMGKEDFIQTIDRSKMKKTLEVVVTATLFFKENPNFITLAVDNDQAGRDFIMKLESKGLPITSDLPTLILTEKTDWNDLLKYVKNTQVFQSRDRRLADVITLAQEEVKQVKPMNMETVYEYSEKASSLFEKSQINLEKFAFLLGNMDHFSVYNQYAIRSDFEKEMMAVTHLYVEYKGNKQRMLEGAIERGLLTDKEVFLKRYGKDFIQSERISNPSIDL